MISAASASAGEPAKAPATCKPGLRAVRISAVRSATPGAAPSRYTRQPASRRGRRDHRHAVGAGDPLRQRSAEPPGRPQQTHAIRQAQIRIFQHRRKGRVAPRLHHKLRVDRGDLMRRAGRNELADARQQIGVGQRVDAHAEDADRRIEANGRVADG